MRALVFFTWLVTCFGMVSSIALAQAAKVESEPLLAQPAPGIFVDRTVWVPADNLAAIGTKLGGKITRISNNFLRIHGRAIQVNVIAAQDEANAIAIEKSLEKIKRKPFVQRRKEIVIEYVGKDLDDSIAIKANYELGIAPKPSLITYQVTADLALIDKADYMSCNPLFLAFLQKSANTAAAEAEIGKLRTRFQFGDQLTLRTQDNQPVTSIRWQTEPIQKTPHGATTTFQFAKPDKRNNIPLAHVEIVLQVDNTGLSTSNEMPGPKLIEATSFWPANDPDLVKLARQITQGASSNDEKVAAILQWLAPGKNIKYSGQTGSRYGTLQVLSQKFGHCWDFSDVFVTLSRAARIPTRQVAGWLYGSSGHVWCEYYVEGKGWQQVDPTGGNVLRCGLYHLAYFTSEDGDMPIVYLAVPSIVVTDTSP